MSEDSSPATVETQEVVEEGGTSAAEVTVDPPKISQDPPQQQQQEQKEEVKSKPTPAPTVNTADYQVVKEGFVQRQGIYTCVVNTGE